MTALERTSICLSFRASTSFSVGQLGSGRFAGIAVSSHSACSARCFLHHGTCDYGLPSPLFSSLHPSALPFFSSSIFLPILLQLFPRQRPFYSYPDIWVAQHRKAPPGSAPPSDGMYLARAPSITTFMAWAFPPSSLEPWHPWLSSFAKPRRAQNLIQWRVAGLACGHGNRQHRPGVDQGYASGERKWAKRRASAGSRATSTSAPPEATMGLKRHPMRV